MSRTRNGDRKPCRVRRGARGSQDKEFGRDRRRARKGEGVFRLGLVAWEWHRAAVGHGGAKVKEKGGRECASPPSHTPLLYTIMIKRVVFADDQFCEGVQNGRWGRQSVV